ncbi:MAG: MaoC family dehydratase N-terminal domain-containing protein [Salinirussus sp.]
MPERGRITDAQIAELKDRIGEPIEEPKDRHVTEITPDTIRHWAHGIGCDNPLYLDAEYAEAGPYNSLIAPPTILSATTRITSGRPIGLPGVHEMWAGADWEWHKPIRRGYEIEPSGYLKDIEEKETDFSGRTVVQTYHADFHNQFGELLASADTWGFRTERDAAAERREKRESVELAHWDEADRQRFIDHYTSEEPRGSETRYFEDVSPGDELDTLLKGPLTVTSLIAFNQGWGGAFVDAHRVAYKTFARVPDLGIPNDQGALEPPERVHWDPEYAKSVGAHTAYDYGPERVAWLGHVATHWMGDDGFLRNLYVEVRDHNLLGDVTWCSGEVTDTRIEHGDGLVEVDLEGRNQRDAVTTAGSATIELPRRSA